MLDFHKSHASSLCVFLSVLVCLKVFEEHLVLCLDEDDDVEEYPSSLSGESALCLCLSTPESVIPQPSRGLMPNE